MMAEASRLKATLVRRYVEQKKTELIKAQSTVKNEEEMRQLLAEVRTLDQILHQY
jgi:hypothetical protein